MSDTVQDLGQKLSQRNEQPTLLRFNEHDRYLLIQQIQNNIIRNLFKAIDRG